MKRIRTACCGAAIIMLLGAAGPLSKFDSRKVAAAIETDQKLEDVERCLMDAHDDLPQVIRQPDRPDFVTIVWFARGPFSATPSIRIDLRRTGTGTSVKAWADTGFVAQCTRPAGDR